MAEREKNEIKRWKKVLCSSLFSVDFINGYTYKCSHVACLSTVAYEYEYAFKMIYIYVYKIMCDKRTHCTFAEMIKQNNKIQYPSYLKSAFIRHTLTEWNPSSYSIIQRPTCKESEGTMWKNVITANEERKKEIFKPF